MTNDQVMACIDGSSYSLPVCDYAAWAAQRLDAPLTLLHALDHPHATGPADLTGSIGFGSQEALLEALAAHDHEAGKLALERGRQMLEAARARVEAAGAAAPALRQVHGSLVDSVTGLEPEIRLLVVGRRGAGAHRSQDHLGSNLERVIRAIHRPILVVPTGYRKPRSLMLAFDNSPSTRKCVELLMRGPLFRGLDCHLVTAADAGSPLADGHRWAWTQLESAGFAVKGGVYPGEVETVLTAYRADHAIDLVVMGAYGHSRIRHLLVGSTTTAMIRRIETPLLLLR